MNYETIKKIEELKMYYLGIKEGVRMYAHWNDGVQYVGTTGKTLSKALKDLNAEEEVRISQIQKAANEHS